MYFGDKISCTVFIHELQLQLKQSYRINPILLSVRLRVLLPPDLFSDRYKFVVCYDQIVNDAHQLARENQCLSTNEFAEKIAKLCLKDSRVYEINVAVKPSTLTNPSVNGYEMHLIKNNRKTERSNKPASRVKIIP